MRLAPSPTISVCMCNYNKGDLIRRALQSVLNQTHKIDEIIFVDDASTDNSLAVASEMLHSVPGARIIKNKKNKGLVGSRAVTFEHATGEWVAFLDSDDYWADNKIELQLAAVRDQNLDFVYNACAVFDEDGPVNRIIPAPFLMGDSVTDELVEGNYITGSASAVLCRRDHLMRSGGASTHLAKLSNGFAEDWDMWLRISEHARIGFRPEILTFIYTGGDYFSTPNASNKLIERFKAHLWIRKRYIWRREARKRIIAQTKNELQSIEPQLSKLERVMLKAWIFMQSPRIYCAAAIRRL